MPGKSVLDHYDQYAMLTGDLALGGAGGTSAIHQLVTGLSNLQKVAWLASRFEYWPGRQFLHTLVATGDRYSLAVTASASLVQAYQPVNAAIYDELILTCARAAAAANPSLGVVAEPFIHDFSDNPILLLPQNIYLFEEIYNAGAVLRDFSYVRIWYKEIELSSEDWYDLLQLRMPLGAV